MDRLRSYRFLGGVLRVLHERSEAGGGLQHGESVDNADMRLPACRDGAVARSCQVRASAGGSLSTGRGCWMRGRSSSRRGGRAECESALYPVAVRRCTPLNASLCCQNAADS